jgi:lambda family phage tail tape measure protein
MANIIAGLGAQLGLDTTEFKKGISEAKSSLKDFKEYLPEALSAAAFIEMTHAAMEFSKRIIDTAKANEVATASVLELSKALEENGGNAETTSKIYSGFTAKLEAAIQGNAKAQESFLKLGVTLDDLRHLSEQELFEKTISGLSKMEDAAQRNGLAYQTLGKAIRGVDIKGLAETLEETKGTMDKYAHSVEQAHELSEKLEASAKKITLLFTDAFLPTLNAVYSSFTKSGAAMETFFGYLKNGAQLVGVFVEASVTALEHLWSTVKLLAKDLYVLFDFRSYTQGTFFEKLSANLKDFTNEWTADADSYMDAVKKIQQANEAITKKPEQKDAKRDVTLSNAKEILNANQLNELYQKRALLALQILTSQEAGSQATKNQREMETELMKVVEERNKALDDVAKRINAADSTTAAGRQLIAVLKQQEDQIQKTYGTFILKTKEAVEANQTLREDFWHGWDQAFNQYKESAKNAADYGKQSFDVVVNSMTSALENFAKTGKLNFADMIRNMIMGIIQLQIQMQAVKASSALFSFMGFSGGSGTPAPVESKSFVPVGTGSAGGGDLSAGQASIVGENGPEIIVPRGASTIIPNHMTSALGGTNQTINNYNIQAIDTKSFEDRIYGSSGAIWAANQYATKNIATTRSRT